MKGKGVTIYLFTYALSIYVTKTGTSKEGGGIQAISNIPKIILIFLREILHTFLCYRCTSVCRLPGAVPEPKN